VEHPLLSIFGSNLGFDYAELLLGERRLCLDLLQELKSGQMGQT
jgi:hypothetical protein